LVRVTGLAVALLPTSTLPKPILLVDSVTEAMPVPVRLAVCGLLELSSFTLRVAMRVPSPPGVKVTLIAQVAPGSTPPAQVLVCEKSEELVPVNVTLPIFRVTLWLLISVTTCGPLATPTTCPLKARLPGESVGVPQPGTAKLEIRVPHAICKPI